MSTLYAHAYTIDGYHMKDLNITNNVGRGMILHIYIKSVQYHISKFEVQPFQETHPELPSEATDSLWSEEDLYNSVYVLLPNNRPK